MDNKLSRQVSRSSSVCSSDGELNAEDILSAIAADVQLTRAKDKYPSYAADIKWEGLFDEASQVARLVLNEDLEQGLRICEQSKDASFLHAGLLAAIKWLQATNLDQDRLREASEASLHAIAYTNAIRRRPWVNHLGLSHISFLRPNYNKYTDEEVMAELIYGLCMVPAAVTNFWLKGKGSKALLSSSWYGNRCYRSYWECENIIKYRDQWDSDVVKANFDLIITLMRCFISLLSIKLQGFNSAPKLLMKFMAIFGYTDNATDARNELRNMAVSENSFFATIAATVVLINRTMTEPMKGGYKPYCGDFDEFFRALDRQEWGGLTHLVRGVAEQIRAEPAKSISEINIAFPKLRNLGKIYLICHLVNLINYSFLGDWQSALECLTTNKKDKTLTIIYASGVKFLSACYMTMIREDREIKGEQPDAELDNSIAEALREASVFKGIFLLKRVKELFAVPMIVSRAKRFSQDLDSFASPIYEVLYLINNFNSMDGKSHLLEPLLARTNARLSLISNRPKSCPDDEDEEQDDGKNNCLVYYNFYKGVLLKHLNRPDEALVAFNEVMSLEPKLTYYQEIIPQTCYELGLVSINKGQLDQARQWLEKANKMDGYFTHSLMVKRIAYALEILAMLETKDS
ncbi:Tetratricopeptide repeat protein 39B [Halotydeus destructor]|nr:Tetratricopeptide repeat protein 39B [Halotydeus destructor]